MYQKNQVKQKKQKNVYIDDVIHLAKMKVDEEGTIAAGVTGIFMAGFAAHVKPSPIPIVRFDRPFQAIVFDEINDMPLFMAQINTLK